MAKKKGDKKRGNKGVKSEYQLLKDEESRRRMIELAAAKLKVLLKKFIKYFEYNIKNIKYI